MFDEFKGFVIFLVFENLNEIVAGRVIVHIEEALRVGSALGIQKLSLYVENLVVEVSLQGVCYRDVMVCRIGIGRDAAVFVVSNGDPFGIVKL